MNAILVGAENSFQYMSMNAHSNLADVAALLNCRDVEYLEADIGGRRYTVLGNERALSRKNAKIMGMIEPVLQGLDDIKLRPLMNAFLIVRNGNSKEYPEYLTFDDDDIRNIRSRLLLAKNPKYGNYVVANLTSMPNSEMEKSLGWHELP